MTFTVSGPSPLMNKDMRERMEKMGWIGRTHVVLGGTVSGRQKTVRWRTGEFEMVDNGY